MTHSSSPESLHALNGERLHWRRPEVVELPSDDAAALRAEEMRADPEWAAVVRELEAALGKPAQSADILSFPQRGPVNGAAHAQPDDLGGNRDGSNHEQRSFDAIVNENLLRGLLLTQRDFLVALTRDPRCTRLHIRVGAEIVARMNAKTGVAFPGHATIAQDAAELASGLKQPVNGYSRGVVRNIISDLIRWGYLVSLQRGPQGGGRAVAHYTVTRPSREQLQREITEWVQRSRARERVDTMLAGVTNADDTRKADVTYAPDTSNGAGVTTTYDTGKAGVTCGPGAGVTCGPGTVTSKRTSKGGCPPSHARSQGATSASPKGPNGHDSQQTRQAAMMEALGGDAAYAARNIRVRPSGKLEIGEEYRRELAETYTESQIERGLERAPSQGGATSDPLKLMAQIRRCCSYAKQDDEAKVAGASKGATARKVFSR